MLCLSQAELCMLTLSCCRLCVVQPWEGDITLVLPSHMWNLGKSIVNPTTTDIINATRQVRSFGCQRLLPHLECADCLLPARHPMYVTLVPSIMSATPRQH